MPTLHEPKQSICWWGYHEMELSWYAREVNPTRMPYHSGETYLPRFHPDCSDSWHYFCIDTQRFLPYLPLKSFFPSPYSLCFLVLPFFFYSGRRGRLSIAESSKKVRALCLVAQSLTASWIWLVIMRSILSTARWSSGIPSTKRPWIRSVQL